MAEKVITGGRMMFSYGKGHSPKLNTEQEKEIDEAYEKYYERKNLEKKKKIFWIIAIIIAIVIMIILAAIFLRQS